MVGLLGWWSSERLRWVLAAVLWWVQIGIEVQVGVEIQIGVAGLEGFGCGFVVDFGCGLCRGFFFW